MSLTWMRWFWLERDAYRILFKLFPNFIPYVKKGKQ